MFKNAAEAEVMASKRDISSSADQKESVTY
jgi:hypothetical protein